MLMVAVAAKALPQDNVVTWIIALAQFTATDFKAL